MMLSEVKRIKIKSNEIERQLENFSLLFLFVEQKPVEGMRCCLERVEFWKDVESTPAVLAASIILLPGDSGRSVELVPSDWHLLLSFFLSLSARFSCVFKLKRNVGPFFVGQLVDLSVKREKRKKMDSPVGHRPC